ncbi:MAG4270 family putative restriction endonuclease [Mycoplasmopsis agalactiae]|uniref:Uncharacterized protein n=1 Tax=Mycoplasmopsis agalactiae TaxID=2110 RepID=D3VQR5_MYCAA|nr:hypothetical protein [Mycoplasmopsis agalactiae]KAB6718546.1 hypothetical protein E4L58_02285 [Mycoplasmopsis agalactiae]CBH40661.1 Conserved hypothetical protein [Mycoplasmopsis agalactiae]
MQFSKSIRKYRLNFATRSLNNKKSNSAKAKGYIDLYIDTFDEIMYLAYWKINFDYLIIDQYTTRSWFECQNSNFKSRNSLFNKLNISQHPRPSRSANLLYELNPQELEITNSWFNSKAYKSTLKNIISIIKGNNAGGSFSSPKAAEIICTNLNNDNEVYKENLIMFLDNIDFKNSFITDVNESNIENYDLTWAQEPININALIGLIKTNSKYKPYEMLLDLTSNLEKEASTRKENFNMQKEFINQLIKETSTTGRAMLLANQDITRKRASASRMNINVFEEDYYTYENAHIYDVKAIKNRLSELISKNFQKHKTSARQIINSNECQSVLNLVNDENNLINLPKQVHDWFDDNRFTYDQNGILVLLDDTLKVDEYNEFKKCTKIPFSFLNNRRKEFINLRNIFRKNDV